MKVSSDLHLLGCQGASTFALVGAFGVQVHSGVTRCHDPVVEAERATISVVEERLLSSIGENAEAGRKDGLGSCDIPHCVPWYQVHKEVTVLVCQMKELVARALNSVHLDWHDVLEDLLHQVLLLSVRSKAHVRLEVASPADGHFANVCKGWNVGW